MKTAQIAKARWAKKNEMVLSLPRDARLAMVREMILTVEGIYTTAGLADKITETYGWVAGCEVTQRLVLGASILHPKQVKATYTLGLDEVKILR